LLHLITLNDTNTQKVALLWMRDQPEAESYNLQYTTLIKDEYPCLQRDSSPQSQQVSDRRPTSLTARPLGSAALFAIHKIVLILYMGHFPLFEFFSKCEKILPPQKSQTITFSPFLRFSLLSPSCLIPDSSNNSFLIIIPNRQIYLLISNIN